MFYIEQFTVLLLLSGAMTQQSTPKQQQPQNKTAQPPNSIVLPLPPLAVVPIIRPAENGKCESMDIRLTSEDKKVWCVRPAMPPTPTRATNP